MGCSIASHELVGLTWRQVIPRESGEVQLAVVGKSDNARAAAS